jgi:hypothetical protein
MRGGINLKFISKIFLKLPKIRLPSLKKSAETIQELAILAGFLMLLKGLWEIYHPLMWIIGGLWLMIPGKRGGTNGVNK